MLVIIKKPSSCSFGNKSFKILKILEKCWKIKITAVEFPSRIWESVGNLGELDNVKYGIYSSFLEVLKKTFLLDLI